jgi:hypothetical protein
LTGDGFDLLTLLLFSFDFQTCILCFYSPCSGGPVAEDLRSPAFKNPYKGSAFYGTLYLFPGRAPAPEGVSASDE